MFQIHQYLEPDDDAEAGQQKNFPDSTISKDLSSLFSTRIEASGQKATCRRLTLGSKRLMAQRAVGYIYMSLTHVVFPPRPSQTVAPMPPGADILINFRSQGCSMCAPFKQNITDLLPACQPRSNKRSCGPMAGCGLIKGSD